MEHLIGRGHREIVLVGSQPDSFPEHPPATPGYDQAMAEAELTPRYVYVPHVPPEAAASAALQYIGSHPEVTAAFCCNDAVAVALIQAAQRAGIDVPGGLSVVGYDDIDLARYLSPQLITYSAYGAPARLRAQPVPLGHRALRPAI